MPPDIPRKRFFAKVYGWTEEQSENASLDAWVWFPLLEEAEAEAERRKQKTEADAPRRGPWRGNW